MRRLKCEKETIILTNEDDGFYDVYTFNQSLQKRLRAFAEKYPDDCWLKGSSEDGSEVLIQLAAVRSAINNTGKVILKNHLDHCIVEAIEQNDMETIRALDEAIDKFIK